MFRLENMKTNLKLSKEKRIDKVARYQMTTLRHIHTLSVTWLKVGCYCVSIFKLTHFLKNLY